MVLDPIPCETKSVGITFCFSFGRLQDKDRLMDCQSPGKGQGGMPRDQTKGNGGRRAPEPLPSSGPPGFPRFPGTPSSYPFLEASLQGCMMASVTAYCFAYFLTPGQTNSDVVQRRATISVVSGRYQMKTFKLHPQGRRIIYDGHAF